MHCTGRFTRVLGAFVLAALVWPVLPGGGPFCAHAAAAGLKTCCCDHSDGRGTDIAGPMDCCRFETPTSSPAPPVTPAIDLQDRAPVAADLTGHEAQVPQPVACGGPGLSHSRAESPPDALFLLNAALRI